MGRWNGVKERGVRGGEVEGEGRGGVGSGRELLIKRCCTCIMLTVGVSEWLYYGLL